MPNALDIIRNEHRSISVVLDNLRRLAREARSSGWRVDKAVFGAIVTYLENFADRVHHPKEDQYLFAALRRKDAKAEELISGLEREHAGGEQALRELRQSLDRFEAMGEGGYAEFEKAVEDFARAYYEHMRKEEQQVFPLARILLAPADWAAIDRAFEENRDPLAVDRDGNDVQKRFDRAINLYSDR